MRSLRQVARGRAGHLAAPALVAALPPFCPPGAAQPAPAPWVHEVLAPQFFAVRVADVDESGDWYRAAFGLRDAGASEADDSSWRILNVRNERLFVKLIRDDRAREVDRARGFSKVGFWVPDVRRIAERVRRATGESPRVLDFARFGVRIIQIRDPDGNIIQLFSELEEDGESG